MDTKNNSHKLELELRNVKVVQLLVDLAVVQREHHVCVCVCGRASKTGGQRTVLFDVECSKQDTGEDPKAINDELEHS